MVATISSNLYQPTFIAKPNVRGAQPAQDQLASSCRAFGIADIISVFDERIQFIVGGRLQRVQVGNYSPTTGAVTSYYDQSAFSPAVGFIAKPLSNVVGLRQLHPRACSRGRRRRRARVNAGRFSRRMKTQQFELGAKVDFGKFATTLQPVPDRSAVRRHQPVDRDLCRRRHPA